MRRHKSYKLKDDSLEQLIKERLEIRTQAVHLRDSIKDLQQRLTALESQSDELENKIIYLLKAKHRTSITVNRVKYQLKGEELEVSLILG